MAKDIRSIWLDLVAAAGRLHAARREYRLVMMEMKRIESMAHSDLPADGQLALEHARENERRREDHLLDLIERLRRPSGCWCRIGRSSRAKPHTTVCLEAQKVIGDRPQIDVNDGAFGEAAYCHHRHHQLEHSNDFDTCSHSICVNARIMVSALASFRRS